MAASVTSISELPQPESTYSAIITSQKRVREFLVYLSAGDNTGGDIAVNADLTGTGGIKIPAINDAYGSTALRVLTKSAKIKDKSNRRLYLVTVEYGIRENAGGGSISVDPWDRAKSYSYSSVEYEYDLETDFRPAGSGGAQKVLNTAGDLFAQPIKARRINTVVTVRYAAKVSTYNYATQAALIDSINDGDFTINGVTFAAYKCLCRDVVAAQQTWVDAAGTETAYYDISIIIETTSNANGFNLPVISKGYRYLSSGSLKRAMTDDVPPRPSPQPVLLSAGGAVTTTPNVLTFWPHRVATWGTGL
jgi:hypothetical protein